MRQIAQAETGWFPPFSRIPELYQTGFDPTATIGFDRSRQEPVRAFSFATATAVLSEILYCIFAEEDKRLA